jgi:hypothetical protein
MLPLTSASFLKPKRKTTQKIFQCYLLVTGQALSTALRVLKITKNMFRGRRIEITMHPFVALWKAVVAH